MSMTLNIGGQSFDPEKASGCNSPDLYSEAVKYGRLHTTVYSSRYYQLDQSIRNEGP